MRCVTCKETIAIGSTYFAETRESEDGHHESCAPPWVSVPRVSVASKADYVRAQPQNRGHHCHWPGCEAQVPPARWGCTAHWFRLPKHLRDAIWKAYRPGQERSLTPSKTYVEVAREVQTWIEQHEAAELKKLARDSHRWENGACSACGADGATAEADEPCERLTRPMGSLWNRVVREVRAKDEARKRDILAQLSKRKRGVSDA